MSRKSTILAGEVPLGMTPETAAWYRTHWQNPARTLDCDHRGPAVGAMECLTCGSRGRLETVYACSLFGECTLGRWRHLAGDRVCSECPSRTSYIPAIIDRRRVESRLLLPSQHQFNNSIIRFSSKLLMAYRVGWHSPRIALAELDEKFRPVNNWPLPLTRGQGQEDPRLWIYRDHLHVSYTTVHQVGDKPMTTDVCYARLAEVGGAWTVEAEHYPHYPQRAAWEKNWGFFEHGGELLAVYSIKPHRVLRIDGDSAELAHETQCDFGGKAGLLHGGAAPVLHQGEFYSFYHRVLQNKPRTYTLDLYTFEAAPPFRPSRHVAASLLTPNASDRQHKGLPNVVFPGGAYRDQYGDWVVSFGYQDKWSELAGWNGWNIEDALKPLAGGPFDGISIKLPTDLNVWKQVAMGNEYRLPDDMTGQVVVDVGANIGSFTNACLARGAARVIACEPVSEFLECARQNCQSERVEFVLAYVTGIQGERVQALYDNPAEPRADVRQIALDAIVEPLPHVDVLKLDCEGPEHSIVANSDLSRVRRIVGECHRTWGKGIDSLVADLERKGFAVEWTRAGDGLWNFWAARKP